MKFDFIIVYLCFCLKGYYSSSKMEYFSKINFHIDKLNSEKKEEINHYNLTNILYYKDKFQNFYKLFNLGSINFKNNNTLYIKKDIDFIHNKYQVKKTNISKENIFNLVRKFYL